MDIEQWNWPNVPKGMWGPKGWNWAHGLAIQYPRQPSLSDARIASDRVWNFVNNLPCIECRKHAVRYVVRNPPDLSSSEAFQVWVWRFHNAVNARLGKFLVSFDAYLRLYADELCWANWKVGCRIATR